jgi:hypothetical protein
VTGKAKIEYFFNPSLLLRDDTSTSAGSSNNISSSLFNQTPKRSSSNIAADDVNSCLDRDYNDALLYGSKYSQHLFMPCVIVKDLELTEEQGEAQSQAALVKTKDGVLHKIRVSIVVDIVCVTSCCIDRII